MNKFIEFTKTFNERYDGDIGSFIEEVEDLSEGEALPLMLVYVANEDVEGYNSYGYEDSTLSRIFYHPELEMHIRFYGTRCSYEGENWEDFVEVKETTKTIKIWENV